MIPGGMFRMLFEGEGYSNTQQSLITICICVVGLIITVGCGLVFGAI